MLHVTQTAVQRRLVLGGGAADTDLVAVWVGHDELSQPGGMALQPVQVGRPPAPVPRSTGGSVTVVAVAAVAFGEEASYRGYPIKNLAEGVAKARWGIVIAVVIPAVFFGLSHATNPNATWLSTFDIVIFGLLFGTGYVLTGQLALPIGLHFGWDFVQGFVFGVVAEGKKRVSARPRR